MNAAKIKNRLSEMSTLFAFVYQGKNGNIDPYYSLNTGSTFHLYFDGKEDDVSTLDEVMSIPFFNGKSLEQISDSIIITEW